MIPQSVIDYVLDNIDLPALIGETVTLAKSAGAHVGLCPFHQESTPSFKVFEDHYHCFGCGAHGNGIQFLMNAHGLTFPDAVRALASRRGLLGIPADPAAVSRPDPHEATREVLRQACARYQRILLEPAGADGMAVLSARGIDEDTIVRFGLGYAPAAWSTLSNDVSFKRDSLVHAGLAVPRRHGKGCYDLFRHRLLFPIRSEDGAVIGFGGRRVGPDGPKYLNSPETNLYRKGRVLFGLPQARPAIRKTGAVIVCEGFFDVITPSQADVEHIVSTCGTALTEVQAERVLSLADRVFFCFDGDAAGAKATWRAAELLVPRVSDHHEIHLCRLPAGEDPDSFVRQHGAAPFLELLEQSPTLSAYLIGEICRGARLPEARARALAALGRLWPQFAAPGMALFFRQYASEALQISSADFDRLVRRAPPCESDGSLRPCPCCGDEPHLHAEGGGHVLRCTQCRLSTPVCPSPDACRAIWNRRERPRVRAKNNEKAHQHPS